MAIRNLMEDIVGSLVDEVLSKEKDTSAARANREDIIAYVLNRVPSKYVTSERGIIHGKIENRHSAQQRTDIIMTIYEGLEVVVSRRPRRAAGNGESGVTDMRRFPHIIGEVLEESTFSFIPDVKVLLQYRGKNVDMVDEDWKNPYVTTRATRGYYHFWPLYRDGEMPVKGPVPFSLVFRHEKFIEKSVDIDLDVHRAADLAKSYVIPIVLLQAKEGVDLDFLYKE